MHHQLDALDREFRSAERRLLAIQARIPAAQWTFRPSPSRWSVGDCVAHLNLTSEGYRPILAQALSRASSLGKVAPHRLRMDPLGWLLWKSMPPPVRTRSKTIPAFSPQGGASPETLVATFLALQQETLGFLQASDGLPIHKVRVASPFNERIHYNLYACFAILAAHQHRHLWQAEQLFPIEPYA